MKEDDPDILCLQETRAWAEQLPKKAKEVENYHFYCTEPEKKGYSGVGIYTKEEPIEISDEFHPEFDSEGRVLKATYPEFILFNVYFPNGKSSQERLDYKMAFYEEFLSMLEELIQNDEKIIVLGDVNTAHKEIDLARPKDNKDVSGFLPQERQWIDELIDAGFVDTFRMFNSEGENYTFWDLRTRARERNVGWRIDYVFVSENLRDRVDDAFILDDVYGSDHCPIGITLE